MTLKYKQLRIDNEDFRENEANLKETVQRLQKESSTANARYDLLKSHAEEKMEQANVEIAKVRSSYEKDLGTLKAKLAKAEVQVGTLERTVAAKSQENIELTKICDELLAQIEKAG